MIVPSQLALKTHTNFGCAASLVTLDKLIDSTYINYIGCVKKDFQLKKKLSESENENGQQRIS
jgi:hypothetical protein